MARNPVQFQKGISLNAFLSLYATEDQCFDALFQWRWPNGFLCPHCGHDRCCQLSSRKLQQCNRCHRQTSITAGTGCFDATLSTMRSFNGDGPMGFCAPTVAMTDAAS